jgi:hypothetical protein
MVVPSPSEQRVRELCAIISATTGAEQDVALAELGAALPALIHEVENFSKYNLINFPSAIAKGKKAI